MRNRVFPPYYSCRYDDSPVRDWLKDFEAWLKDEGYTVIPMRKHMCVVRSVLEQQVLDSIARRPVKLSNSSAKTKRGAIWMADLLDGGF